MAYSKSYVWDAAPQRLGGRGVLVKESRDSRIGTMTASQQCLDFSSILPEEIIWNFQSSEMWSTRNLMQCKGKENDSACWRDNSRGSGCSRTLQEPSRSNNFLRFEWAASALWDAQILIALKIHRAQIIWPILACYDQDQCVGFVSRFE